MPAHSPTFLTVVGIVLASSSIFGQGGEYPAIDKFAGDIKGITWDLRGTNTLKHLQSDGAKFYVPSPGGGRSRAYDTAFVDVGVVRLNFSGSDTGWYFFSDDLKYMTSTKVSGEVPFKLSASATAKPVVKFPEDIEGAVWESVIDDRKLPSMKLRWTGKVLDIGLFQDNTWKLDKETPIVAGRRVLEVLAPNGAPLWFAFSADGKEAWMLQIEAIFGGQAQQVPAKAAGSPGQTGLTPQMNDLINHAEDLLAAGEKVRADSLRRHALRALKKQPELARAVEKRLGRR